MSTAGRHNPTMSSREIAELTGKEHNHVMRDIRAMLAELHGEGDLSKFGQIYKDEGGRSYNMYALPKRETLILVSGYNVKMRAAIIDRWQELEAKPALPQSLPEALRLAADLAEQKALALAQRDRAIATKRHRRSGRAAIGFQSGQCAAHHRWTSNGTTLSASLSRKSG